MSLGPFWVGDIPSEPLAIDLSRNNTSADLTDFTAATATLIAPDGTSTALTATLNESSVTVAWGNTGSPLTQVGAYVVQVKLTGINIVEYVNPVGFLVQAPNSVQVLWANVGDVKAITGKDVTDDLIYQAQAIIETRTGLLADSTYLQGRTPDTGQVIALSLRDSHYLKLAVAYQAAWVASQPDLYDRVDTTNFSQDGASATFTSTGMTLSPHARNALKLLSWLGTRSVAVGNGMLAANYVEALDDSYNWQPLNV